MEKEMTAILMATYNGEKFIAQQIDSILSQTSDKWHLFVHDDGSQDNTIPTLEAYIRKYPRQITLLKYPPQGGSYQNFMSMLKKVESDYYMFCDQDDIWHKNKLSESMLAMKNHEKEGCHQPIVIHTDLRIINEEGEPIAKSFWKQAKLRPDMFHTFEQRISNVVTGCTMLFNRPARDAALRKRPQGHPLHDEWVTICTCAENGVIVPLFRQLIDYRQHSNNVVGAEACYNKKTWRFYTTHLRRIWMENKENYRVLKSAGYGSVFVYIKNKIRNFTVYKIKY